MSEVNQGIISTLFEITSIYLAIIFWYSYGQKMRLFDFFGMILLIVCAIMIIFSKDGSYEFVIDMPTATQSISPLWSVLCAIICTILFCIKGVMLKFCYEKMHVDSTDLTMVSFSLTGLVCLVIVAVDAVNNGIDWLFLLQNLFAGVFE
jgi:drug/metabolite transporter (DMT)-like permease